MNARERFLRYLSFQPVDRPFHHELGMWGQTLDRWWGEGMPRDIHVTTGLVGGSEYFRVDRLGHVRINAIGMLPTFQEEVLHEDEQTVTKRHRDGHVSRALKGGEAHGFRLSMDQMLSFPVTDRASWEAVKRRYNCLSPARYPEWWDDVKRALVGRDYPVGEGGNFGTYSFLRRLMGTEAACTVFYDDPLLAEDMLEYLADYYIELMRRVVSEVELDFVAFWEDFAYNSGPLVGPNIFRKFLLPRYQRIIDFLRSHGVKHFWLDSDGNCDVLIPLLIEAGITLLWPVERAAGMDPLKIRQQYGHDLCLGGGFDKRALIEGPAAIEHEMARHVPRLLDDGGYLVTIDHWIPPDVSYENFLYYMRLKLKTLGMGDAPW